MQIEVLVSTMHQQNTDLIDKMNLNSDAIIINQTDYTDFKEVKINENTVRMFSFNERGVGLSRNSALMRSDADICVLADDDMFFCNGYEETIEKVFSENPQADVIIFNLIEEKESLHRQNDSIKKVGILNYMNYGAARIAFRRKAVTYNGISFNLNFGGGTKHLSGEDTLFLRDCIKRKLKIIAVPYSVATLKEERESTWFKTFDEKYFFDKGVLLKFAHPLLAKPFAFYLAYRHKNFRGNDMGFKKALKEILKGISFVNKKEYKKINMDTEKMQTA